MTIKSIQTLVDDCMSGFLEAYTKKAIRGWKGLRMKHLPNLLPVDLTGANLEEVIPYTEEEALDLIKSSTVSPGSDSKMACVLTPPETGILF